MTSRIQRVFLSVWKRRVVRGVLTIMSGHVAGQAVALLLLPVLTRLYSPADFGGLAIYTSLIGLGGVTVTLRYDAAIPIPKSGQTAGALAYISAISTAATCFAIGLILFLYCNQPNLPGALYLNNFKEYLLFGLFFYGIYQILLFWSVRIKSYGTIAVMRSTLIVSAVSTQLMCAWIHPKNGLILGQFSGYVTACGTAIFFLRKNTSFPPPPSISKLYVTATKYKRFPFYSCGAELFVNAAQTVPPILLVGYYSDAIAGLFLLAWRAVGTPLTLLVVPTARVVLAETSHMASKRNRGMLPFLKRTIIKLLCCAAPPVALLAIAAPTVFPAVFGEQWNQAGIFCAILCPVLLCHLVSVSVRPLFDVLGYQSWNLVASFLLAVSMIGGIIVSHLFSLDATIAVASMSLGGVTAHVTIVALVWHLTRSHTRGWAQIHPELNASEAP